jgi:hypothetical protein
VIANLTVDRAVRSKLGDGVVRDLLTELWPLDCQTCGRPPGDADGPTLVVDASGDRAWASVHHAVCRSSGWRSVTTIEASPHVTWRAGAFLDPEVGAATVLVNPSCEAIPLTRDRGLFRGHWRTSGLERFAAAGFRTGAPTPAGARGFELRLSSNRLTIMSSGKGPMDGVLWSMPVGEDFVSHMRSSPMGMLFLTITHHLSPRDGIRTGDILRLSAAGETAEAVGRVTSWMPPLQEPRVDDIDIDSEHTISVCAVVAEMVRRSCGVRLTDAHMTSALALCDNSPERIDRLGRDDQIIAALLVAFMHRRIGPVHLVTPDTATKADYLRVLRAVCDPLHVPLAPIGERSWSTGQSTITYGTQDEFLSVNSSGPYHDVDLPAEASDPTGGTDDGQLALLVSPRDDLLSAEFLRRYRRVARFRASTVE